MTEAINAHKKMAMGMTEGNVMKKGGKVKKFSSGGKMPMVMKDGEKVPAFAADGKGKMKKGGMSKKPGIMIAIAIPKKGSSRGR